MSFLLPRQESFGLDRKIENELSQGIRCSGLSSNHDMLVEVLTKFAQFTPFCKHRVQTRTRHIFRKCLTVGKKLIHGVFYSIEVSWWWRLLTVRMYLDKEDYAFYFLDCFNGGTNWLGRVLQLILPKFHDLRNRKIVWDLLSRDRAGASPFQVKPVWFPISRDSSVD